MKPAPAAANTAATNKSWRVTRWLGKCLLWLLVISALALAAGYFYLQKFLADQQIQISWRSSQFSFHSLTLHDLFIQQADNQASIAQLSLTWNYQASPLERLELKQVLVSATLPEEFGQPHSEQENTTLDLNQLSQWLPKTINIEQLNAVIANYGAIDGDIFIDGGDTRRLWQPSNLRSRLSFSQLQPAFTDFIPAEFTPQQLTISVQSAHEPINDHQQVLAINIDSLGASQLHFKGVLSLDSAGQWSGSLADSDLLIKLPHYALNDLQAKNITLQAQLVADANMQQANIELTQLQLTADEISQGKTTQLKQLKVTASHSQLQANLAQQTLIFTGNPSVSLEQLSEQGVAELEKINLQLKAFSAQLDNSGSLALSSATEIKINKLKQDSLKATSWDITGKLTGDLTKLNWQGTVKNAHGLTLTTNASYTDKGINANLGLAEIFFRAGNPLAKSLADWPKLIELTTGRLNASATISIPATGNLNLKAKATASGLGGIVNSSELKNLGLQLEAQLTGQQLTLKVPNLTFDELNPGMPIGPARLLNLTYKGNLAKPLTGQVNWDRFTSGLLQGQVSANQQSLKLNQEQTLLVDIKGLEIQEMLRIYPADGLAGQGIIDGKLPLAINVEKMQFSVDDGKLGAREQGYLKFTNERINQMGRANPAMQLVSDALSNFQYQVLKSDVTYGTNGKLKLNLELKGSNPKIENGRPIHFAISLEEDIPALLASLQLSNQVSETIQKRVQERLQNRKE